MNRRVATETRPTQNSPTTRSCSPRFPPRISCAFPVPLDARHERLGIMFITIACQIVYLLPVAYLCSLHICFDGGLMSGSPLRLVELRKKMEGDKVFYTDNGATWHITDGGQRSLGKSVDGKWFSIAREDILHYYPPWSSLEPRQASRLEAAC
jgi:hypothetical protein